MFVCFDAAAPLTPCPSSADIITGITPLCRGHQMPTFLLTAISPSLLHGSKASIDQLNRYMMFCVQKDSVLVHR